MKIFLIGYGRMGQLIEKTAVASGDEIVGRFDADNFSALKTAGRADVAMDFSNPSSLPVLSEYIRRTGTPLLSGTTGFTDKNLADFAELGAYAPVLHSGNYSLGVAVFRKVLAQMTEVLGPEFDIEIVETHHNQKVDAPSGTALMLRDAVDPKHKKKLVYGREGSCGKRTQNEIGIHSLRGGTVAGVHTVGFYGPDEEMEITHRAASRQIFANGALHMARLLAAMPKGSYDLQELLFGK
ncbi:MAG: 4-hydroxy-tetrahydrodipicolinate reductase [Oscillospiraceae bacterium]|nr:4-hydroxy-tetrahydrodipicolinate reductase [Oscillospiraceae bacterium]